MEDEVIVNQEPATPEVVVAPEELVPAHVGVDSFITLFTTDSEVVSAMQITGAGCVVRHISNETRLPALVYVPGARIAADDNNGFRLEKLLHG